jgi:acetyl esterase/lipase
MPTYSEKSETAPWFMQHPCSAEDQIVMAKVREIVSPNKGKLQGVGARAPYKAIMEGVAAPQGVAYDQEQIRGIPGWWCRPLDAPSENVVMHLHGGWFNWGTAEAFRHFGGHLATHIGAAVFLPDYRLAPENPFPAALEDIRACYLGLIERGASKIAITGDSAGGSLALGLLAYLAHNGESGNNVLVGGVAISPVTDLTLSGESWESRATSDPLFIKSQAAGLVQAYLAGHAADDPDASPLFADLKGVASIRVHVGNDEVLLDDSVRFLRNAIAAGVDARLDVWEGMIHGFLGSIGRLQASTQAFQMIGDFLNKRFNA